MKLREGCMGLEGDSWVTGFPFLWLDWWGIFEGGLGRSAAQLGWYDIEFEVEMLKLVSLTVLT